MKKTEKITSGNFKQRYEALKQAREERMAIISKINVEIKVNNKKRPRCKAQPLPQRFLEVRPLSDRVKDALRCGKHTARILIFGVYREMSLIDFRCVSDRYEGFTIKFE